MLKKGRKKDAIRRGGDRNVWNRWGARRIAGDAIDRKESGGWMGKGGLGTGRGSRRQMGALSPIRDMVPDSENGTIMTTTHALILSTPTTRAFMAPDNVPPLPKLAPLLPTLPTSPLHPLGWNRR